MEYPSLPRYIFLLAHARIFPWAGKNKSGYRDGKMKPNSSKITDGRRSASLQLNDAIR